MDFQKLLAEAEKITDPVAREAEFNRISRLMLGAEPSPARQAATSPVAEVIPENNVPQSRAPTMESAKQFNRLIAEQKLAKKTAPDQRMDAYSDDELEALVQGFSSEVKPEAAEEEIGKRKEFDEEGYLSSLEGVNRLAGQVVGGAAEIPTSAPIAIAGLVAKGAEKLAGNTPLLKDPQTQEILFQADDILKAAAEISSNVRSAVGISEPRNVRETIAGIIPSVVPIGGVGPTSALGNVVEAITPLVVGSGNKRILANFATQFVADQALREIGDDATSRYLTAFDVFPGEDKAHPWAYDSIMTGLGLMAGASIIAPMTAQMMRAHRANKPPTLIELRDIDPHAPKNLKSLETAGDVYKTYLVDEKSVLSGLAERAGVPGIESLNRLIDQDTQIAGIMRVNEAMRTGKLDTVGGSFSASISPQKLHAEYMGIPEPQRKNIDLYLKYQDLTDDLKMAITQNKNVREARKKLVDARKNIAQLEASTPIVKDFHKKYQSVTSAVRSYLGQGPNAMISQAELARLAKDRANWVPIDVTGVDPRGNLARRIADGTEDYSQRALDSWYTQRRDLRNIMDIDNRADSMEVLMDYTRNALKSKMEHDVRGAYIRGLKNSPYGKQTVRRKNKKDGDVNPNRMIEIYENGERSVYLSSKLQANLLKFDPYVAKFPVPYAFKRGFEQLTTGFASVFAPYTAIRDTIAGNTLVPNGVKGPGTPVDVMNAIFKQNWANTQRAAMEILDSNMNIPFIDGPAKKLLSQQISSSYMNSMFHLANTVGGFDASIMKSSIENAKGSMAQAIKAATGAVGKNVPGARVAGRSIAALGKGWMNLFDSIQEAPRFAAFERNVKAGMNPIDASREAKKITGDTMRSGRVYGPKGDRITADAVNRELLAPAKAVGWGIEAARETAPYFNPTVQGLRRLADRMIDDPVGTNLKAWTYVGLPAMVAMGWNDMLGEEYNKFAFEERSSKDIAMNLYVGIPGLPPEQGAQIPLPHELMMFNSPWTTALYALNRGADGDEVGAMMKHMAGTVLENSVNIGFPQIGAAGLGLMGVKAPQSMNPLTWKDDVYELREDNIGVFPQNVEEMLRSTWGTTGQLVMASAAAGYEGGPEAFFDEMGYGVANRLPVVKNILGTTTPVTNYTSLSQIKQSKIDALDQFNDLYTTHFLRPNLLQSDKLMLNKAKDGTELDGTIEDADADYFSTFRAAPLTTPKPDNPIYEKFGGQIKEYLSTNAEGYTSLSERSGLLSKQIKQLRAYTAGRKDAFEEYKKEYVGADARFQKAAARLEEKQASEQPLTKEQLKVQKEKLRVLGEAAKIDRLVKDLKLDLSKREDVLTLVAYLEREKSQLMQKQISMIKTLEDKITGELRAQQLIRPDKSFKMEKHLGPSTPTDLFAQ